MTRMVAASWIAGAVVALWAPSTFGAPSPDPASVVAALDRADWQAQAVRPSLPAEEAVADDRLEVFDWIERAYVGGAIRVYESREDRRALAVLFEGSPAASARRVRSGPRRDVWSFADCTVVLPSHVLTPAQLATLRKEPLTPATLRRHLGAWSYWWHAHGEGSEFVEYVPEGLSFLVRRPGVPDADDLQLDAPSTRFLAVDRTMMGDDEDRARMANREPPPIDTYPERLTYGVYRGSRRPYRRRIARQLCANRKRIRRSLARGLRSPDGRFVVAPVNLGGTYNNQQIAVGEVGKPERRYRAEYFVHFGDYCWLDTHTILYRVGDWDGSDVMALDVSSGTKRHVLHPVDGQSWPRGRGVGCLGGGRFWYATRDGVRHEAATRQTHDD